MLSLKVFVHVHVYQVFCITSGLLWFVQYSMFHFVKKMTNLLTSINLLVSVLISTRS
jgi:uncharacterized membrane protein